MELDGEMFFLDDRAEYWVRFSVTRVRPSKEKPHGLDYSLTLHGPANQRLVGFDNAHAVQKTAGPSGRRRQARDHKHRLRTIRPYDDKDAATLLADFWHEVDSVLKEKGVLK